MNPMDPTVVAAAIVTLIAALTGSIVTIVNAVAAAADRRAAIVARTELAQTQKATERKADTIIEKATQIHSLADGNLSKVTAALEVANTKIDGLQKHMNAMLRDKVVADRAAETAASRLEDGRIRWPDRRTIGDGVAKVEVVNTEAAPVPTEVVNTTAAPVPTVDTDEAP